MRHLAVIKVLVLITIVAAVVVLQLTLDNFSYSSPEPIQGW